MIAGGGIHLGWCVIVQGEVYREASSGRRIFTRERADEIAAAWAEDDSYEVEVRPVVALPAGDDR